MWLIPDLQSRVATSHARLRNRQTDFLQFCISLVPAVGNNVCMEAGGQRHFWYVEQLGKICSPVFRRREHREMCTHLDSLNGKMNGHVYALSELM